jgi:hypothetical protein
VRAHAPAARSRHGRRDGVGDRELRLRPRVPVEEVENRLRDARARTCEDRRHQPPVRVEEQREDDLGTEPLHHAGEQRGEPPLRPDQGRDDRGDELAEQGGAWFPHDEGDEHPGEQPRAVQDALETGQERPDGAGDRVLDDSPDPEDDAGRDGDDTGDDDVDDPPAEDARTRARGGDGCMHWTCPFILRNRARDVRRPPCAGMTQIRFDGRDLEKSPLSPAHRTPVFASSVVRSGGDATSSARG